jgi:hypothetical protein
MIVAIGFIVFLGAWIGVILWALTNKKSMVIGIGGGFIAASVIVVIVSFLYNKGTAVYASYESPQNVEISRKEIWSGREIISVEKVDAAHSLNPVIVRSQNKTAIGIAPSYSKQKWIVTYETPSGIKRTETLSYDPTAY